MSPYLHQTENRLRIRSDFIRQHPQQVVRTISRLQTIDGVKNITHRVYAGSVAICFCSKQIAGNELLDKVKAEGWLTVTENRVYLDKSVRLCTRTLAKGLAVLTFNLALKSAWIKKVATCVR